MYSEFDGIREDAADALAYALDGLDRLDYVEARLVRLEKALQLLIEQHPFGAQTALDLDPEAYT